LTVTNVTTYEEWKSVLDTGAPVVVDFHGEAWCQPCQRFAPTFKKVAEERPDIAFVKVDIDLEGNEELRSEFEFQTVPAVFVINGDNVDQIKWGAGPAFLRKVNEHVPQRDSD